MFSTAVRRFITPASRRLAAGSVTAARTTLHPATIVRLSSTTASQPVNANHGPDTYAKDDIDATPPESSVYRIDASADTVQKPNEKVSSFDSKKTYIDSERPKKPLRGEAFNRSGGVPLEMGAEDAYNHAKSDYTVEGSPALRYGGKQEMGREGKADLGPTLSGKEESADNQSKFGRV